jgi:divalent metal cation (Fe/Co/Zn/Cd) transporter
MAAESRKLLIGERAHREIVNGIYQLVVADADVSRLGPPLTMQLAPDEILVALDVEFKNKSSIKLSDSINRIEKKIKASFPETKQIFIEAKVFSSVVNSKRKTQPKSSTIPLPLVIPRNAKGENTG